MSLLGALISLVAALMFWIVRSRQTKKPFEDVSRAIQGIVVFGGIGLFFIGANLFFSH
jgi:hypothetical protein